MRDSHFELDSLSSSSRIGNVGQGFADISTCLIAENLKWSLTGKQWGKKTWLGPGSEVELCASNRLKGKEKVIIQILKNSCIFFWKYLGKVIFSYKFLWYFIQWLWMKVESIILSDITLSNNYCIYSNRWVVNFWLETF